MSQKNEALIILDIISSLLQRCRRVTTGRSHALYPSESKAALRSLTHPRRLSLGLQRFENPGG
jgi:hypothetical protein